MKQYKLLTDTRYNQIKRHKYGDKNKIKIIITYTIHFDAKWKIKMFILSCIPLDEIPISLLFTGLTTITG